MTNFIARATGFASLALAILPAAALSTAAHAQGAPTPYAHDAVHVADLNMGSAAGKQAFATRVDHVARRFCADERNLTLKVACQAGVRSEANEKAAGDIRLASRI